MKKLIYKVLLLSVVVVCMFTLVAYRLSSGLHDPYYNRLTSPKASSMVIGTSRAAQGILPQVLNKSLRSLPNNANFQNFAFTLGTSPFGPVYLDLIKSKLAEDTRNGLFIVAVDPWALSTLNQDEEKGHFREENKFTHDAPFTDLNPNIPYILKHFAGPYYKTLLPVKGTQKLHSDGWLEINVPADPARLAKGLSTKLRVYNTYRAEASLSSKRIQSMKETVRFLKKHGKVVLVRIPVSKEMAGIENAYTPNFDALMNEISSQLGVPYLNYVPQSDRYLTTDGNHLHKDSGHKFTAQLAKDILAIQGVLALQK